jgi:hypothetical protein
VAGIREGGAQVKDYIFDIAKRLPARALVEEVMGDWGRLDILVNHANVRPRASILGDGRMGLAKDPGCQSERRLLPDAVGRTGYARAGRRGHHPYRVEHRRAVRINDRAAYWASMTGAARIEPRGRARV